MKQYLSLLVLAVTTIFVACQKPEENASLSVNTAKIQFDALGSAEQTITVDAVNVAWNFVVSDDSKDWISVEREDNTLIVAVADNTGKVERKGTITIESRTDDGVGPKTISVKQSANIGVEDMRLKLSKSSLTFRSNDINAQEVIVYASNVDWDFEVAADSRSWVKAERKKDKLEITVDSKNNTGIRQSEIKIIPKTDKAVEPKTITVTQNGMYKALSLECPGFFLTLADVSTFIFDFEHASKHEVLINTVGGDFKWTAELKDADKAGWLNYSIKDNKIYIAAANNDDLTRTAKIVITTEDKNIAVKTIEITQRGKMDTPVLILSSTEDIIFNADEINTVKSIDLKSTLFPCTSKVLFYSEAGKLADWVKCEVVKVSQDGINFNQRLDIQVTKNESDKQRGADIFLTVYTDDGSLAANNEITVIQNGK